MCSEEIFIKPIVVDRHLADEKLILQAKKTFFSRRLYEGLKSSKDSQKSLLGAVLIDMDTAGVSTDDILEPLRSKVSDIVDY